MSDRWPHSYLSNGSPICWCGENHPCDDCTNCGGNDKAGTCTCPWEPVTQRDLDELICAAMEDPPAASPTQKQGTD